MSGFTPQTSDTPPKRGRSTQPGAAGPAVVQGRISPPQATRDPQPSSAPRSQPVLDYDAHYKTHDPTPAQLWVDIQFLREKNRFAEIERAIQAYLKYHGAKAEPWMYLLLATAFEFNQRGGDSARTALGWAGYLARKQGDPFTLIEVADVYLVRDTLEVALPDGLPPVSAGALLGQAGDAAPDRYEPILLSILLAEKTNDPGRMAAAVERLMELAWPGYDETWRGEARRKAEALAQKLEQQGKSPEATTLLDRLEAAETRDLFIRLTWQGDAGIDLVVDEPLGARATVLAPRTVFGGAIVKSGRGKRAESVYSCPRGFDGDYAIRCETLYNDQKDPARDLMLEVITHEGMPGETRQTHAVSLDQASPIVVKLSGARRKRVLPFQAPNRAVIVPERLAAGSEASTGPVGTPASRAAAAADILRRTPAQPPDSLRPDDPQAVPKSNR